MLFVDQTVVLVILVVVLEWTQGILVVAVEVLVVLVFGLEKVQGILGVRMT